MKYTSTATFVKTSSGGYQGARTVVSQDDVSCIFIQNTGLQRASFDTEKKSDAVCFPNPKNEFIETNLNSLEGFYVVFEEVWYKIVSYTTSRSVLLSNKIDNIEIELDRVTAVAQIS